VLLGWTQLWNNESDTRDLLDRDVRTVETVALFCYQVKKRIGAFAVALGDLLVLARQFLFHLCVRCCYQSIKK
jgi:hypothetical protein